MVVYVLYWKNCKTRDIIQVSKTAARQLFLRAGVLLIENIQMDRIIQPLQDVVHEMEGNEVEYENTPLKEGWKRTNDLRQKQKPYLQQMWKDF